MNLKFVFFAASMFCALAFTGCKKVAIAEFTASKSSADAGETITFTNESSNANSYSWDFGDGTASSEQSPTHVYSTTGTFVVNLTAKGERGTDHSSASITVVKAITVFEGEGIKELKLGASWAEVKTTIDTTGFTKTTSEQDSTTLLYPQEVFCKSQGIDLIFFTADSTTISDNDVVDGIFLISTYVANTSKGIAIGDGLSEIKLAYGTPTIYTYTAYKYAVYAYPSEGISFFYATGKSVIYGMEIFRPYASSKKSAKANELFQKRFF